MREASLVQLLSRKTLLIFDLDGTIADSSSLHRKSFVGSFAPYGIEVDYPSIAGLTTAAAVDRLAKDGGIELTPEQREALIADKQHRARSLIKSELEPIEGSIEFIRRAQSRFILSICTSASRQTASLALERLGISDCFESIFTAADVAIGKPSPAMFLKCLRCHGTIPESALVFEDSDSGLQAARAASIDALKIVSGRPEAGEAAWPDLERALERLG